MRSRKKEIKAFLKKYARLVNFYAMGILKKQILRSDAAMRFEECHATFPPNAIIFVEKMFAMVLF